jgi:hypothetical protein
LSGKGKQKKTEKGRPTGQSVFHSETQLNGGAISTKYLILKAKQQLYQAFKVEFRICPAAP